MRGRGVGSSLNRIALGQMAKDGLEYAGVRTLANNYPAMRNCFCTGFDVTSSSLHFHQWIRDARVSRGMGNLNSGYYGTNVVSQA
jgi:hypothetical protein